MAVSSGPVSSSVQHLDQRLRHTSGRSHRVCVRNLALDFDSETGPPKIKMTRRGSCLPLLLLLLGISMVSGVCRRDCRSSGVGGDGNEIRWNTAGVEVVRSSRDQKYEEEGFVVGAIFKGKASLAGCSLLVDGEHFEVEGEKVKDSKGRGVEWATSWDEGCGLRMRTWPKESVIITLTLSKGGHFQQDKLKQVNVIVHMEDQLLTRFTDPEANNIPTHYNITIDPDLLSTSPSTKFKGRAELDMLVGPGGTGKKLALHMDTIQLESVRAWGRRRDYSNIVTDTHVVYHSK